MVVVSDKLVYLEMQKTASTSIRAIFVDLFGATAHEPRHAPLVDPEPSKIVVGSVRNPWDYYVSLWSFGCRGSGGVRRLSTKRWSKQPVSVSQSRTEIRKLTPHHLPDVGPFLREITLPTHRWLRHYAEPHTPEKFNRWLVDMHTPARAGQFDPAFGATQMRRVAGFATYRYCRLFTSNPSAVFLSATESALDAAVSEYYVPQTMIRFEHLADDLIATARVAGYEVDETLEKEVRERAAQPRNRSSHKPYWEYYDDASRELVRRRDAVIVERHGYVFGS